MWILACETALHLHQVLEHPPPPILLIGICIAAEGLNSGPGFCGTVQNVGGLAMRADPGIFSGSLSLQLYISALAGPSVPDIVLKIASDEVRHNLGQMVVGAQVARD